MADYLTKKELLREIHNSKITFGTYLDPAYQNYHAIVSSADEITPEYVAQIARELATPKGKKTPLIVAPEDVVVRLMTYEHIPLDPDRKRKARNTDQSYARTNFPPYKHFVVRDGEVKEVGRSHWQGGFENGCFSVDHGAITTKLASMYMLLVERIGRRPNWRGYSYLSEMQGEAIIQLCASGLMFDESRSDNPFAFYTTTVNHSFVRVVNKEKRVQVIRDDLMEIAGAAPSNTRLIEHSLRDMFVPAPLSRRPRA